MAHALLASAKAAHRPAGMEGCGGDELTPGKLVAEPGWIDEPEEPGDPAFGRLFCTGAGNRGSCCFDTRLERRGLSLAGYAPADIGNVVLRAGMHPQAAVGIIHPEPGGTVAAIGNQLKPQNIAPETAPFIDSRCAQPKVSHRPNHAVLLPELTIL